MSDLTYREIEDSHELSHIEHEGDQELLTLNMGPHHPATHGVLRLLTTLEGEIVRDIVPMIGYVHTGIEKTAEDKAYWKVIPVVERMDYLAYFFNAMAFCGAVETILELEVPPRGQWLRVLHMELNRIMSHLVWLGDQRARPRRDLDVLVLLPRPRADPRPVRDVDRPAHAHALLPGRRRDGGHPGRVPRQGARVRRADARRASTSTSRCWPRTRSCCTACAASRRCRRARRCSGSASPARCCARPATRGTCARPRRTRATRTSTSRSRSARPATTGTASRVRTAEMQGVLEDHPAVPRRPARGPVHHREPQVRAAAAARAGDLDGGADPPLQARHRGLPRAAGRGVLPDRVPARRARLLRARRRLLQAGARAHARPLVREPAGDSSRWCRTSTSPT